MKRQCRALVAVVLIISFVFALTACGGKPQTPDKTTVELGVPTLTLNAETKIASWTVVENAKSADGYTIKIGTAETVVTGTSYSLASLTEGAYQISVKTNGYETDTHKYVQSAYCTAQDYIVAAPRTAEETAADARSEIEGLELDSMVYNQAQGNTQATVKSIVQSAIQGLNVGTKYGVTIGIINGKFTAAVSGTSGNTNGTNGSAAFTIQIQKGSANENLNVTITIIAIKYAEQDGTSAHPFIISTATQFNNTSFTSGNHYALDADIPTLNGTTKNFNGDTFDGRGFKIQSLSDTAPVFGTNTGTIKNLNIGSISFNRNIRATGYSMAALALINEGSIINCHVLGGSITLTPATSGAVYPAYAGGLVYRNDSLIENCSANVNVSVSTNTSSSTGATNNSAAGGLVGIISRGSVIKNSFATGNVSAAITQNTVTDFYSFSSIPKAIAGGLVGMAMAYGTGDYIYTIQDCYATGNVMATFVEAGGDSVNSRTSAGGIIGDLSYVGGITIIITNCFTTGSVITNVYDASTAYAGGIVGYASGISPASLISNCVAANSIIIFRSGGGGSGYTIGQIGNTAGASSYYYEDMKFYRFTGYTTTGNLTTPTSINGATAATLTNLNTASWWTGTLGWDTAIWDFSDLDFATGKIPTLKPLAA